MFWVLLHSMSMKGWGTRVITQGLTRRNGSFFEIF